MSIPSKTKSEFLKHEEEHNIEIKELDISTLTPGHEMFEFNMCIFESGHENSVNEHLIDHLNHKKEPENLYFFKSLMSTMTMEIILRKILILIVTMILKQTMSTNMKHRQ